MRSVLGLILGLVGLAGAAYAGERTEDPFIRKQSLHSVEVTLDRLAAAVEAAGAKVFARIDHSAGAASIDQDLAPTQVLVFGNPRLGTPLMQSNRDIAIDLPLKALAYQDPQGQVWLAYVRPDVLKGRYAIEARDPVFGRMTKALAGLTDKAVAP